jgi:hypothetical protein
MWGCATSDFKKDFPIGAIHHNSIVFEGKKVPLPNGEWRVAGTGTAEMGKYNEITLVKTTDDRKFAGGVIITSDSVLNDYTGYVQNKFAERKDHHYVEIKSNSRSEGHDIWLVSHYLHSFNPGEREMSIEFTKYLVDNQIDFGHLSIRSYHEFTGKVSKKSFLRVSYFYNPETEGFDTREEQNWGTSGWHVTRIASDPLKKAFVEKIKQEGKVLHQKLLEGFDF